MRKLMYEVVTKDGRTFSTASYRIATENGNKIVRDYLVPVKELYPKAATAGAKPSKSKTSTP